MDYKRILLEKINKLLKGEWIVPQFEKEYYFYYLNDVPDGSLTNEELMFFGDIQEKLDWTDKNPDQESRSHGWMDYNQYVEYVRMITDDFLQRGKYDSEKWGNFKLEILKNNHVKSDFFQNRQIKTS